MILPLSLIDFATMRYSKPDSRKTTFFSDEEKKSIISGEAFFLFFHSCENEFLKDFIHFYVSIFQSQ